MSKIISATHDVVFKALFVRNHDLLKAFLWDILDLPITDDSAIKVLNPELVPKTPDGKMCRLDVLAAVGNRQFNVEMQARSFGFSAERTLCYWCKMYGSKVKAGSDYAKLKQSYSINILGFNFLDCDDYHSSYSIWEDRRHEKLTDKLSIHIFELLKVPSVLVGADNKQMWLELIKAKSVEELEMVRATSQNPLIHSGVDAVLELNADVDLCEKIRLRDEAMSDYESGMARARRKGMKRGLKRGRAEGMSIGLTKGREEGLTEGLTRGREEGRLGRDTEITEKMRQSGYTEEQIKAILG